MEEKYFFVEMPQLSKIERTNLISELKENDKIKCPICGNKKLDRCIVTGRQYCRKCGWLKDNISELKENDER